MCKGSERRQPYHPVDRIFVDPWSPRAMSGGQLPEQLQARETPNERRPLMQSICEGPYSL